MSWWAVLCAMAVGVAAFGRTERVGRPGPAGTRPDGRRGGAADAPPEEPGPVTVVVPARNEATSLPGLLADLARSRPPDARVIVVDDHSEDETAALAAAHPFVTVVRPPALPLGWTGKTWACHHGAAGAADGTLVFIDADVRLAPGALDDVVAIQRSSGAVVSVQPHHVTERWWERCSGLFNVVSWMGAGAGSRRPNAIFGPVICCSTADYRRVGGHAAVRDRIVEDVALGRRFARAGVPSRVLAGGPAVRFRMYPDGWRSMIEGWTKNMAIGASATPIGRAAAAAVFVTGSAAATWMAVSSALAVVGGSAIPATTLVAIACAAAVHGLLLGRVGAFGPTAGMWFPALTVVFVAIVARSVWLTAVRHEVRWRGRVVPVGTASVVALRSEAAP